MDVVSAITGSSGVRYRGGLEKAAGTGSGDRAVESLPTGPTFSPQDSDGAERTVPPVIQLVRESAEHFADVVAESRAVNADGVLMGSQVDVYA